MSQTFTAILRGDRLEWTGEGPGPIASDRPVPVEVTILGEGTTEPVWDDERRRRMFDALDRLAARGALAEITDPVGWQREIRRDRPLPGREP